MENYGTHKTEHVKRWLKRHPRFKIRFIPTSSSWMNLVARWFAELTAKAVRRGSFASVPDLIEAIEAFIRAWNSDPKPCVASSGRGDPRKARTCPSAAGGNQARLHGSPRSKASSAHCLVIHTSVH
jgi:hypothetical protein